MKLLAKIWIGLAISILLLHSFVPHQHHEELSETEHFRQHQEANSLFNKLLLGFHVNPGERHLEDLKVSDSVFPVEASPLFLLPFVSAFLEEYLLFDDLKDEKLPVFAAFSYYQSFINAAHSLRGPPTLS